MLFFLVACHNPESEDKAVDTINMEPASPAEPTEKSNLDKSAVDDSPRQKAQPITLSTGPVHECAFLEKDAGMKFCSFENEISGTKIFSCTQTFQQAKAPFAKVIISAINYSHPQIQSADVSKSISEKFEYDKKLDAGTDLLGISNAYLSEKNPNQRKVAFFRGNFLVRITEIAPQSCFNFDDLIKKVVEKVEERVDE